MNQDLVSVIIPTYNRAYCIERAIDSAISQINANVEVVVVDDGSTDNTRDLIMRRFGDDARVRYIFQENRGVSSARNHGIREARGNFAAFLDSDDIWKPWKLALQLCVLSFRPDVGMVWSDMEAIDANGIIVSPKYLRTMYKNAYRWFSIDDLFSEKRSLHDFCPQLTTVVPNALFYWGDIFSPMVMGNLVHTSTVLIRLDRLKKVVGFNEDLKYSGEDYDFHLRTCKYGPVAFIDLATIDYQIGHTDQLTRPAYHIHMAQNFLKTISPVLQQDRSLIQLPRWMLNRVQAEAHGWIGSEYLYLGEHRAALRSLLKSLRYWLWQPRIWALLILAILPHAVFRVTRGTFRFLKYSLHKSSAHKFYS
jgi:glycosyltransferase involved in cell wall biosynthesis